MVKKKKQETIFSERAKSSSAIPNQTRRKSGGVSSARRPAALHSAGLPIVCETHPAPAERVPSSLRVSSSSPMEMEISAKAIKWFVTQRKIWRRISSDTSTSLSLFNSQVPFFFLFSQKMFLLR
jgi:hypothetical protein